MPQTYRDAADGSGSAGLQPGDGIWMDHQWKAQDKGKWAVLVSPRQHSRFYYHIFLDLPHDQVSVIVNT